MQEDNELLGKGWAIPPHATLPPVPKTDDTIRIKFDTNDQASMVNAITQLAKEATPIQLAALVVFEAERTARAERYAKMLELLLPIVGAVLGGALALSVYYNIT